MCRSLVLWNIALFVASMTCVMGASSEAFRVVPRTVQVDIVKDRHYNGDTNWTLTNRKGKVVLHGSSPTFQRRIGPGRFCFRMTDAWGDGICCGRQGNGRFTVTVSGPKNVNGTVVASGGNFRYSSGNRCFHVNRYGQTRPMRPRGTKLCPNPKKNPQRFHMCLDLVDPSGFLQAHGLLQASEESLIRAKRQWESVILGGAGKRTHFTRDGLRVRDLYVEVVIKAVDGQRGTLAYAAPGQTTKRTNTTTTVVNGRTPVQAFTGIMHFDLDDIPNMIRLGNMDHVVMHELGHILGIGTLFRHNHLYDRWHPEQGYQGDNGNFAYRQLLVDSGASIALNDTNITLPIEQDGGIGVAHGHFDERCLFQELMTGMLGRKNTFSNITIAVLEDLGFEVNYTQAVNFTLPPRRLQTCLELSNSTNTNATNANTTSTSSTSASATTNPSNPVYIEQGYWSRGSSRLLVSGGANSQSAGTKARLGFDHDNSREQDAFYSGIQFLKHHNGAPGKRHRNSPTGFPDDSDREAVSVVYAGNKEDSMFVLHVEARPSNT